MAEMYSVGFDVKTNKKYSKYREHHSQTNQMTIYKDSLSAGSVSVGLNIHGFNGCCLLITGYLEKTQFTMWVCKAVFATKNVYWY